MSISSSESRFMPPQPSRTSARLLCGVTCVLVIVTCAVYGQTAGHEFVNLDDLDYIVKNPHVTGGVTAANIAWAFTSFHAANWHPLTWLSHMLDVQLFGLNPAGHHLMNVAIHALNAVLLLMFLRRVTGSLWRSAFVAALFALHPLHVESVAWVAERKDLLSTLFLLITLMVYCRYAERPGPVRFGTVMAALALGLLAKPMLVTVPLLLLLLDFWPLGRLPLGWVDEQQVCPSLCPQIGYGQAVLGKLPLLALSAVSSIITVMAQKTQALQSLESVSLTMRITNAVNSCCIYLGKTFWPVDLAAFYPLPLRPVSSLLTVGAACLLAGITYGVLRVVRQCPWLTVGWFWYLISLMPVIGIVQVGLQARADRYTYIPLIGVFIALVWGAAAFASRLKLKPLPLAIIGTALLATLSFRSWRQVAFWKNGETLFDHTLAVTRGNYFAQTALGVYLQERKRYPEALAHLREAIAINPGFALAHNSLGVLLLELDSPDEADRSFRTALALAPNSADIFNNLATIAVGRGQLAQASGYLRKAIQLKPDYAVAHFNLGTVLDSLGRTEEAAGQYREVLRITPDYAPAHNNLGTILLQQGKYEEADIHFTESLRIDPQSAIVRRNIEHLRSVRR